MKIAKDILQVWAISSYFSNKEINKSEKKKLQYHKESKAPKFNTNTQII